MTTEQKYSSIFNGDFYPTPKSVIELMQIDCRGLNVLEPQAGKGDIIQWLQDNGAAEVSYCEINKDLAEICKSKARFINNDFLKVTAEQISHISQIVMNPPFSEARKHILHAWNIAPEGCEIISICNADTLERWSNDENSLYYTIENFGNSFYLGNVFNQAERTTNASISCIKLYKPISTENTNFDGFYMDAEPEMLGENGIMKYNEIQALVNSYIGAMRCYDKFEVINEEMKNICSVVGMNEGFKYECRYGKYVNSKNEFSKALQKRLWHLVFDKLKINKYLTTGVQKDINKFIETQTNIPFTVKNIYRMFEIIMGTREQILNRALVETVDSFTERTHENRYGLEGWKTNAGHLLNKKFIVDCFFEVKDYGYEKGSIKIRSSHYNEKINDLYKVLCHLTGRGLNDTRTIDELVQQFSGLQSGKWYLNNFFEVKGFKKGTAHFKFTDDKVWELLNRKYAEIKGQNLPEKL